MTVTASELHYEGSLGVDEDIMDQVGMIPYEKVLVINESNNARYETYLIPKERGSKDLEALGPGARDVRVGDKLIIIAFAQMTLQEAKDFKLITVRP